MMPSAGGVPRWSCSVKNSMITLRASPASSASTEAIQTTKSQLSPPPRENARALRRRRESGGSDEGERREAAENWK